MAVPLPALPSSVPTGKNLNKGNYVKLLYKKNYILRDLYVILHEDKYLMVYRSSGLNPGRAGRILPFEMLAAPARATIGGDTPGLIYKEFYFNGRYTSHRKKPHQFGPGIAEFLLELEEYLEDKVTEPVPFEHIESYKELLPTVIEINDELSAAIKGIDPFDWQDVVKLPPPANDDSWFPEPLGAV